MNIFLILLMVTHVIGAAQKDKQPKVETSRKKRDLGKNNLTNNLTKEEKEARLETLRQELWSPCLGRENPTRVNERRLSDVALTDPFSLTIPQGRADLQIVDLRGKIETQNLDEERKQKGCLDRIIALCYGPREHHRPPLERQRSRYPDVSAYISQDERDIR